MADGILHSLPYAIVVAVRKLLIHIKALKLGSPELVTGDKKMADAANLLVIKTKLLKKVTSE